MTTEKQMQAWFKTNPGYRPVGKHWKADIHRRYQQALSKKREHVRLGLFKPSFRPLVDVIPLAKRPSWVKIIAGWLATLLRGRTAVAA